MGILTKIFKATIIKMLPQTTTNTLGANGIRRSGQTSYGNSQDAPPLMNGLRKCGIYTQWNFMQP
jgi:hypothetical protein